MYDMQLQEIDYHRNGGDKHMGPMLPSLSMHPLTEALEWFKQLPEIVRYMLVFAAVLLTLRAVVEISVGTPLERRVKTLEQLVEQLKQPR